ncbi:MAG: right-handed parallel beta-helix repeat-containing protein [Ruminococcaceae bacterium]|nr:right-handed parallel beta-helix repeat-containing protein [Oscillospiraceae bacterium]
MVYFVDGVYGSDKADGTSRQTAWRSLEAVNSRTFKGGDKILFKAGCTFEGNLYPRREDDGGLIVFGRYGVGDKPEISAESDAVCRLTNFGNVEVRDLALTAPKGFCGIYVEQQNPGPLHHIYIHDCYIHDINEERANYQHESGGIVCVAKLSEPVGWFDDLLIEDNKIINVARSGIWTMCSGRLKKDADGVATCKDDSEWQAAEREVIRGNYLDYVGGDGIVILGAKSPLIEWNTLYHPMHKPQPHCSNAGIWPQSTTDCVMQYNEVGYMDHPEFCADGQGFDVDAACSNTLVQYNYSHDNGGGFILLCEYAKSNSNSEFSGTVVRNNLSVNDGNIQGEILAFVGPVRGALIENNTFYSAGKVERLMLVWTADGKDQVADVTYRNNLFISNGKGNKYHLDNAENIAFENNVYWGAYRDTRDDEIDPKVFDPRLVLVGEDHDGRLNAANYVPLEDSPVLTEGAPQKAPSPVDFFGNPTDGKAYVGAFVGGPRE